MSYATIIRDLANKVDENPEGRIDDILFLHTYLLLRASMNNHAFSRGKKTTITMTSCEKRAKDAGCMDLRSTLTLENGYFKVAVSIYDKNDSILERGFALHVEVLKKNKLWYKYQIENGFRKWGDSVDIIIDDLDALLNALEMTLLGEWVDLIALVNVAMDGGTVKDLSDRYECSYVPNYAGTFAYCTDKGELDLTKMSDIECHIFHTVKKNWWYGKHLDSWILLAAKQTVIKYGEKACREADEKELIEMYAHTIGTDFEWRYGLVCGEDDGRLVSLKKL
jgi:hypothetical protein